MRPLTLCLTTLTLLSLTTASHPQIHLDEDFSGSSYNINFWYPDNITLYSQMQTDATVVNGNQKLSHFR